MQIVADIFSAWPNDAELGRDIGVPYPTVSAWKQRGSIPPAYWRDIVRAAKRRGRHEITADLLADLHARKPSPGFAEDAAVLSGTPADARRAVRGTPVESVLGAEDAGHFSRHKHSRRSHFRTADEIEDHIRALREEWSHR